MKRIIYRDKIKKGDRFGYLVVIKYSKEKAKWLCKCKCGNFTYAHSALLAKGIQKSCNCGLGQLKLRKGDKFGKLTLINWDRSRKKWHCRCECGNDAYASTQALKTTQKGCGCQQKGPKLWIRLPDNLALRNAVYSQYRNSAKNRKIVFKLNKKTFFNLINKNCYYCGNTPQSTIKYFRYYDDKFRYNGIDRINSEKGYTNDNCVTCCSTCNYAKSEMKQHEFFEWIKNIFLHHKEEILK
jgi:5-methylcytosine-specific restriction endonuclease McrA